MNNIWKDLGLEVGKIIADEIKGGPTSGNYGHGGRPGERGGSTGGGGHGKLGIEKGASREDARAAIDKHREARAQGKQPAKENKKDITKPKINIEKTSNGIGISKENSTEIANYAIQKSNLTVGSSDEVTYKDRANIAKEIADFHKEEPPAYYNDKRERWNNIVDSARPEYLDENARRPIEPWRIANEMTSEIYKKAYLDVDIRKRGKEMISKYPGRDSATGQRINIGDKIIFDGQYRTVLK